MPILNYLMNFSHLLTHWYLQNKRDLPWRNTSNPYAIWLSEIILQQTQVVQGIPYFNRFIARFPTVKDLALADEESVLKLWQGLGYYSRARHLLAGAKFIYFELNGSFPNNYKDLLKLKGVGPYTAAAIASISFNEPKAVVDGNVYRVLSRFFNIITPINSTEGKKEFDMLAQQLLDVKNPANHNQALMELGALICKPNNPLCLVCPLNTSCLALKFKNQEAFPVKLKREPVKNRYFNYIVIQTLENKTVFLKRTKKDIWLNLYEFPLIETQKPIQGIEITEEKEFKILFKSIKYLDLKYFNDVDMVTKLTHQQIFTKFWVVKTKNHPLAMIELSDLKRYPVPMLIHNFLKAFKVT